MSYMKIIDVGRKIIANRIHSYMARRIQAFLSGLHIVPRYVPKETEKELIFSYSSDRRVFIRILQSHDLLLRPIWLVMHGQTKHSAEGRLGGDPPLTPLGEKFAQRLAYALCSAVTKVSSCE
jgi:hypothetical protein